MSEDACPGRINSDNITHNWSCNCDHEPHYCIYCGKKKPMSEENAHRICAEQIETLLRIIKKLDVRIDLLEEDLRIIKERLRR